MKTEKNKLVKTVLGIFALTVFFIIPVFGQNAAEPRSGARILLVPLDDRPPCLQFTIKMGEIGDAEVIAPPKELLGKFTTPGQSDKIIDWLKTQDLKSFDAAIIALDMVAYGGLVASRVHGETDSAAALRRIDILREIRRQAPKLTIYGQNVIMRLAPTGTGANESYRAKLADWAEFSPYTDEKSKEQTARLEREIPAEVLADYKRSRERNLKINLKAIEFVGKGIIDYLILSQDDAKPRGIHVADREKLIAETARRKLTEKIAVQPGADEVSMLLLARALNNRFNYSPKIKAVYSSQEMSNKVMPFEDRTLRQTVSFHIKATGSKEIENQSDADLLFFVYASRFESGRSESFAREIFEQAKTGKKYIIADIDPKGDVQGADPKFTDELLKRDLFFNYSPAGYASWNTAGNTIGTALPQGVVFALANDRLLKPAPARGKQIRTKTYDKAKNPLPQKIAQAQLWFTMHRLLDDYIYHTLVRADAKKFAAENKLSTLRFDDAGNQKMEAFIRERMRFYMKDVAPARVGKSVSCCFGGDTLSVSCSGVENFNIFLPWSRTFEAEIDFELRRCSAEN